MDKEKTKEEYLNSISKEEKKRYYKIAMEVARRKKAAKIMDDQITRAGYAIYTGGFARMSNSLREKFNTTVMLERAEELETD